MQFKFDRHRRWDRLPEHQKRILAENQEDQPLWERFFHRYATFLLSGFCFGLFILALVLYFTHTWADHEPLIMHLGAVFLELGLAILVIEELIKSNLENEEEKRLKWEKKKHFLRKMLRNHMDTLVFDYLKDIEHSANVFAEIRSSKTKLEVLSYEDRMFVLDSHASYFHYFDRLAPKHSVLGEETEKFPFEVDYSQWETLVGESLKNVRLVASKPQYTPHLSWDTLIEWYVALKRFKHRDTYVLHSVTQEEEELRLYMAGVKFFSAFVLDLEMFGIFEESRLSSDSSVVDFAHRVWDIWHS